MPVSWSTQLAIELFSGLDSYGDYLDRFPFFEAWGGDRPSDDLLNRKLQKHPLASVDSLHEIPYPPEFDDLIRLHFLSLSRNVCTVLEIGAGYSTHVLNDAMLRNRSRFPDFDGAQFRKIDPWKVHSVESDVRWRDSVMQRGSLERVEFHISPVSVSTFQDRVCTYFSEFPNVAPDLIYLDGPDQFNVSGDVRGVSTRSKDRMPMSADLLAIEHFLSPGTLIVVDGRTANARFLAHNFQRDWVASWSPEYDNTYFLLAEEPLGRFNSNFLEFSGEPSGLVGMRI